MSLPFVDNTAETEQISQTGSELVCEAEDGTKGTIREEQMVSCRKFEELCFHDNRGWRVCNHGNSCPVAIQQQ